MCLLEKQWCTTYEVLIATNPLAQKLLSRHWRLDTLVVDPRTVGHRADDYFG